MPALSSYLISSSTICETSFSQDYFFGIAMHSRSMTPKAVVENVDVIFDAEKTSDGQRPDINIPPTDEAGKIAAKLGDQKNEKERTSKRKSRSKQRASIDFSDFTDQFKESENLFETEQARYEAVEDLLSDF